MVRVGHTVALAGLLALAAGCGANGVTGPADQGRHPNGLSLDQLNPTDIKANYVGDILLTGHGFMPQSVVTIDGTPVTALRGFGMDYLDDRNLVLHITGPSAGELLHAGDRQLAVSTDPSVPGESLPLVVSASLPLHVRPILVAIQHQRTLPVSFNVHGGFIDFWEDPIDSEGNLIAPGTELATAGLGHSNFQWKGSTVKPLAGGAGFTPSYQGVADVQFYQVSTARPLAVALAIDMSGSMNFPVDGNPAQASDPGNLRIAAAESFVAGLGPMDQADVRTFLNNTEPVIVPFTANKQTLQSGLKSITPAACCANTPLYDAMIQAVNDAAAMGPNFARAVVVLTDGVNNTTSATTLAQAIANAQAKGIPIFTIGLGNPAAPGVLDQTILEQAADQTGGRFLYAQDATALQAVFLQLSSLLGSAYQLDCAVNFDPPLSATGNYLLIGSVEAVVDGESVTIAVPQIEVSVL